jgi:hypothetical protein
VGIDPIALTRFVRTLLDKKITTPSWDSFCHYSGAKEEVVGYILVLDTINFCFWPEGANQRWEVNSGPKLLSGYYGLASALKQALESGIPLTNAEYLANLTLQDLHTILGGQGSLQLMDMRVRNLNELGQVLLINHGGATTRLVESAAGSAVALARTVAKELTSFRDVARYQSEPVYFYKRAQILAADLHGALNGTGWGRFTDIDQLTAFADYKLPQVLRHLGVLHYAAALEDKVDHHMLLEPGSREEVEIRANTVWAVELMRREAHACGINLRASEIDWVLWNLGQEAEFRVKPYHRTKTIYY